MDYELNKSKILSSFLWKLMERNGAQGIQFVVQIILARILLPEDYGTIALIMIFIAIANIFVQSGFSSALIQKKDADKIDFSSVFYLSLFVAFILYAFLYITAPILADFYQNEQLVPILRLLAITLIFGAFNSVQNAFIARNMLFKNLFFSSLGAIIISGTLSIAVAYKGLGIWALVVQQLTNQLMNIIILWYTVKWRPSWEFSLKKVKKLFSYGSKLLISSLIETIYQNLWSLIIGKIFNPAMLGYYSRGQQFPSLLVSSIDGTIQAVMLPVLSSHQDDRKRVKDMMRRAIVTSSFFIFPMMVGLAIIAEPLIKILLTDKWLLAVPFLQIFCGVYALFPIHTANLQAINALGRSDIFLKLEIIKKLFGLAILAISIPFGIYVMAWANIVNGIISTIINAYPNKKLLNYSYLEQWKDIMPSLFISLLMGAAIYLYNLFNMKPWLTMLVQISSGAVLYFILAKIFKIESFAYILQTVKDILKNKKKVSLQKK